MSFSVLLTNQMRSFRRSINHVHAFSRYYQHPGSRRHCQFVANSNIHQNSGNITKSHVKKSRKDLVGSAVGLSNYRTKYSLEDSHEDSSISNSAYQFQTIFDSASAVTESPKVTPFSEQTFEWIVDSVEKHMDTEGDSYSFHKANVKLLSDEEQHAKALVSCTAQLLSQWLITRMLSQHHFVHSFTKSDDFEPLENLFKLSSAAQPTTRGGITTMDYKANNLRIEQMEATAIDEEWARNRGYHEYFDVIFDGQTVDNVVFDEYVNTTIYGQCLKKGGVLYVSDKKMAGDIAGSKLRYKMSGLYPNSHFQLVAERDTAWDTQFVFLKALSCSERNVHRECDREDEWGDGHLRYVQSAIWEKSKVRENAGRDVSQGLDRVANAFENYANPHRKQEARELPWFSSLKG